MYTTATRTRSFTELVAGRLDAETGRARLPSELPEEEALFADPVAQTAMVSRRREVVKGRALGRAFRQALMSTHRLNIREAGWAAGSERE